MSLSLADGLSVTLISTVGSWAVPAEVGVAAEAPCAGGIVASGARIPSNIVRTVSSLTALGACAIDLRYERFKSFNVIGLLNLPCNLSTCPSHCPSVRKLNAGEPHTHGDLSTRRPAVR